MARAVNKDDNGDEVQGIQLPASILEKIQKKEDTGDYEEDDSRFTLAAKIQNGKRKRNEPSLSRKDKRKSERESKKQKRIKAPAAKPPTNQEDKNAAKPSKKDKKQAKTPSKQATTSTSRQNDGGLRIVKEDDLDDEYDGSDLESNEYRVVKEDDLEDEYFGSDLDDLDNFDSAEEDDFEGFGDLSEVEETEKDALAKLKALKDKKSTSIRDAPASILKSSKKSKKVLVGEEQPDSESEDDEFDEEFDEDDFEDEAEDLEEEDDPLAKLKALKEAKKANGKASAPILKLINSKKSHIEVDSDEDNGEFDEELDEEFDEDDFEDEAEDLEEEEDPLAKLKALKEAKKANSKTSASLSKPNTSKKSHTQVGDQDESDDDNSEFDEELDEEFDEDDFEDEAEDLEEEDDPLAKLKALKEAKKASEDLLIPDTSKEAKKKLKEEKKKAKSEKKLLKEQKKAKKASESRTLSASDDALLKKDDEEMEFYAKKLGLKHGKKSKLSKTDDDDIIGGLLDGLDLDFGSDYSAAEEAELSDFPEDDESGSDDFDSDIDSEEEEKPKQRENPYVAPVSEDSAPTESSEAAPGKYVPPALRRKLALEGAPSEEIINLRRALKGPLNRLSEANVSTIVNEINGLFLSHPRSTVNEELTSIILDSIIQQGRLLDTFVYLHATLVTAIYRLQGVEFGAHFIQTLIEKFEGFYNNPSSGKEASNLISLLSSVYLFSLVSSRLLYDVIKKLIGELNENNSELLLRLIKGSGNQMRSDDPSALKEIVLMINKVYATLSSEQINPRTQYLIETITSLKNNKLKVNNDANHLVTIRLKKFLSSINNNKFNDPIQVSLSDIHDIATRGKWWLVGSAWKGHDETDKDNDGKDNTLQINDVLDGAEPNWMELARAQRMNTDIRRAIFISIMSANDYVDAITKLDKLTLKRSQEREIPRVLIHCAGVEPSWNPYYGVLAHKLCNDHAHRKTFQFILWDLIKEFEGGDGDNMDGEDFLGFDQDESDDSKLKRILNLGRFFGHLLAEGSLPLHVLRTINFLTASNDTVLFLEVMFVRFIDQIGKKSQINSVGAGLSKKATKHYDQKYDDKLLIERCSKAQEQQTLLRGMQHFLQDKVLSSDIIDGKKQRKRVEWGVNALIDIVDEFLKAKQD